MLSDIEQELGNSLTLYGHSITRGGAKVAISPSPSPVVWLPAAPAVGGGGSGVADFSASTLGQYVRAHEDTSGVPKCKGLVRPVFEVEAMQSTGAGAGYGLVPGAAPGKSMLWLLSTKKIEVLAGVLCFLAEGHSRRHGRARVALSATVAIGSGRACVTLRVTDRVTDRETWRAFASRRD